MFKNTHKKIREKPPTVASAHRRFKRMVPTLKPAPNTRLRHLAAVIESSDDAIISMDLGGKITSWNAGAERLYGFSEHEAIGKSISILAPPDKKDDSLKILARLAGGEQINHYETQRMTKDKRLVYVSISESPIKDISGNIIGASKIARDMTDKKILELNLKYLSDASKILSSSLDIQTTLKNVVRLAVPQFADWCSIDLVVNGVLTQVEVAHRDPAKIQLAKDWRVKYPPSPDSPIGIWHVIRTGKSEFYPDVSAAKLASFVKKPEIVRILLKLQLTSAIIVPINSGHTCIGGITFVRSDNKRNFTATDLSMAEDLAARAGTAIENARLYEEARHAINIRNEFISIASHELKTPVASLKLYTQLLQKHFEEKGREPYLLRSYQKIHAQIDKLNNLIRELLNVSRLDYGRLEYKEEHFDLYDLVQETIETIRPMSHKHTISINGNLPKIIHADRDRIGQVLTNLLTNAIKYSQNSDRIKIHITPIGTMFSVEIEDFGIGIPKEHQDKIFNRFYRVHESNESVYPGLGLGLYISNEIVKRHGGEMYVRSQIGKGTTVGFRLPYRKQSTVEKKWRRLQYEPE